MKRTMWNLLIDSLAAVSFVGMIATGYILHFPLPPGTHKSLSLWGLTRHEWGAVHFWISLGLLAILLIHVVLHWQWIVTVVARQFHIVSNSQSRHFLIGLVSLAILTAVLGLFAWATHLSVQERNDSAQLAGEPIKGSASDSSASAAAAPVDDCESSWKDVSLILERSCLPCHSSTRAAGDFRIDRREDFFGKYGKALIVPGNATESPLIAIVSGQRPEMAMAARHKLPEQDVAVLHAWIDAGAPFPATPDKQ